MKLEDDKGTIMIYVDWKKLTTVSADLLGAMGVPDDDARGISEILVEADLRGIESHGVTRLGGYLNMISLGLINPKPNIKILTDLPTIMTIDADQAIGFVAARQAMQAAIEKARETGIACVTAKNLSHTGMAGYYPLMAANQGLIGLWMNNGPRNVPPFGGVTPVLSTNPIAAAVPAGTEDPIAIDMSTTIVALGQLRLAAKLGLPIPLHWATDRAGVPTTDPQEAIDFGSVQWAGGHKGYALGTLVETLSGVLSGGLFGMFTAPMKHFGQEPINSSAFCLAIDPTKFMPASTFYSRVCELKRQLKSSERATGILEVFVSGEQEFRTRSNRLVEGIPLPETVFDELKNLALLHTIRFDLLPAASRIEAA